jgi:hypothetical protein
MDRDTAPARSGRKAWPPRGRRVHPPPRPLGFVPGPRLATGEAARAEPPTQRSVARAGGRPHLTSFLRRVRWPLRLREVDHRLAAARRPLVPRVPPPGRRAWPSASTRTCHSRASGGRPGHSGGRSASVNLAGANALGETPGTRRDGSDSAAAGYRLGIVPSTPPAPARFLRRPGQGRRLRAARQTDGARGRHPGPADVIKDVEDHGRRAATGGTLGADGDCRDGGPGVLLGTDRGPGEGDVWHPCTWVTGER